MKSIPKKMMILQLLAFALTSTGCSLSSTDPIETAESKNPAITSIPSSSFLEEMEIGTEPAENGLPTVEELREFFRKDSSTVLWLAQEPALPDEVSVYSAEREDSKTLCDYLLAEVFPDAEILDRTALPDIQRETVQFSSAGTTYWMESERNTITLQKSPFGVINDKPFDDEELEKQLMDALVRRSGLTYENVLAEDEEITSLYHWMLNGYEISSDSHWVDLENYEGGCYTASGDEITIFGFLVPGSEIQALNSTDLITTQTVQELCRAYYNNLGMTIVEVVTDFRLGYYYDAGKLLPAYILNETIYRTPTFSYDNRLVVDAQTGLVLYDHIGR